jgi:hypothetical protein
MAEKIFSKDIFGDDLTKKQIKEFEALIKVLEDLEKQQKANLKLSADELKMNAKEYDSVKKNQKAIQEFEKSEQQLLRTEQQREKLQQERIRTINQGLTQQQKQIALSEKKRKIAEKSAREELKLNSAYAKQSRKLNDLRKEYKDLIITQGKETKATKKMRKEIQKLDKQLKGVDASAGQFQRSVGNYGKALGGLRSLASAALPVAGITGVVTVIGNAVNIFKNFEKANSNLKAVTGATDEEMKLLSKTAKELGSTTAFTASEVTGLQTEFAKLGFTTDEIQNATAATLDLAAASGTDLADAAAIAGSTLGGFQLGAEETQRVVDVMAKSFSTSALDMEKFKESMKDAAPAAAAVGISVEETTALLGTLANAGISGSKAGTALKSSLINLNKAGLTLNQGFEKVANSTDKLGEATKLVGKNAAASFLVLAEGTKTTEELTKGLIDAEGAAQDMAAVQLDNLEGDITKLSSAWEGFILNLESGNGVLAKSLRNIVQFLNKILEGLSLASMSLDEIRDKNRTEAQRKEDKLQREQDIKEFYNFILKIENISQDEFKKLSKDRQKELADRFLRISRETLERLKSEGKDANDTYFRYTENTIKNIEKLAGIGVKEIKGLQLDETGGGTSGKVTRDKRGITPKRRFDLELDVEEAQTAEIEGSVNLTEKRKCELKGGFYDPVTKTCIFPDDAKKFEEYQQIITAIVDKYTTERINAIDKEIEANQRRQETLRQLAGQGIQDAKENLAQEKKQQAELEREKERALKRQQQIELGLAVLNSYSNNVENDADNPLAKTITDTQVLLQFIQSLPTFYDGTENTGQGGQIDNKGGFHAILHPNERVMTAEQNQQLDGISNWELANIGKEYKDGKLNNTILVDNSEVVNKLDEIVNKPTYLGRDYDATEKAIIETIQSKGRIERNHKRTGNNKIF